MAYTVQQYASLTLQTQYAKDNTTLDTLRYTFSANSTVATKLGRPAREINAKSHLLH